MQMLNNKKAVVFDLDGTLVDSMWMWDEIDVEYLAKFNYSVPPGLQREIEGKSFDETAVYFKKRFDIPDSIEEIQTEWLDMARYKYQCETPLKEGAAEFIRHLSGLGIRLGIASSNSIELVQTILKAHQLEATFVAVHTCSDVTKGKPEPDVYLLTASNLGVRPQDCLVFEDVPMGITAGRSAGMETCAVWDSYSVSQDREKRELADYYIHTYYDVLNETYEVLKG